MSRKLGDFVSFRNGKVSPERSEGGRYQVFGSNGPIGHTDETNCPGPAIVVGRVGSFCGSVHYSECPIWVTDNALSCTPHNPGEERFWFYGLRMLNLNSWSSGSGQPLLNQETLRSVPFEPPPELERLAIAEVLGALDDLIDTNERTIAVLGRAADAVFLAFDPTSEPQTFAGVVDIFGGGTPPTSNDAYWNGDVRWATPTDLTALSSPYLFDTAKRITQDGLAACSSRLHPVGSILMTSRATIGRIALAQVPTATNQGFIVLRPRDEVDGTFLIHELRTRVDEFISRANGSTFLEISRGTFKTLQVDWPSREDREQLHAQIAPLHEAAIDLERENEDLRRARDELLPLLMSGKVRVRNEGAAA